MTRRSSSPSITTPASCATAAFAAATRFATTRSSAAPARATRPTSPSTSTSRWANSTCVSCGECMVSCPTGASDQPSRVESSRGRTSVRRRSRSGGRTAKHPLFEGVSHAFLAIGTKARSSAANFQKGDIICREGEFGSTAFVIEEGHGRASSSARRSSTSTTQGKPAAGLFGMFAARSAVWSAATEDRRDDESTSRLHSHRRPGVAGLRQSGRQLDARAI